MLSTPIIGVLQLIYPTQVPYETATEYPVQPTYTPEPAPPTLTPWIVLITATPVPTNTETPVPTNTATPVPTNTETPVPTNTETPVPTNTATPVPTNTPTPVPTDTPTPVPTNTATPSPLIVNGFFDTGDLSGWDVSGDVSVISNVAYFGLSDDFSGDQIQQGILTSFGFYTLSYTVGGIDCAPDTIELQVDIYDDNGFLMGWDSFGSPETNYSWQVFTTTPITLVITDESTNLSTCVATIDNLVLVPE